MEAHGTVRSQGGAVGAQTGDVAVRRAGSFASQGGGLPHITGDVAVGRHGRFDAIGGGAPRIPLAVALAAHGRFHCVGAPSHTRPKAFTVEIGGDEYEQVLATKPTRIEDRLDGNVTASFMVQYRPGEAPRREPGGQYLVVIRDRDTEAILFSGVSQGQTRRLVGPVWITIAMRCVGWTILEGREITNDEGRLVAKEPTGSAQLIRAGIPLERVDVRYDPKSIADLRLKKRGFLLSELRRRNEKAILYKRPTATGVSYGLADIDRLTDSGIVLSGGNTRRLEITEDAAAHVRRQRVIAGNITRIRTLFGDGVTTRFFLGDRFDALDYLAPGVSGAAPGESSQDRGVRFREDTEARLTDGALDLFGGEFPASTPLYLDLYAVSGSQWSLYVDRAANKGLLDYSLPLPAAVGSYGLIVENLETERKWASTETRITNAGIPTRQPSQDVTQAKGGFRPEAIFSYNGYLYILDDDVTPQVFLAYDPDTGEASPDNDIPWDDAMRGLIDGPNSVVGAFCDGDILYLSGRQTGYGRCFSRYNLATNTAMGSTLFRIRGSDRDDDINSDSSLPADQIIVANGYLMALGGQTLSSGPDQGKKNWGLWAFDIATMFDTQATALTVGDKSIKLDRNKTWRGCALRGNTIYAINDTDDTAEAFNAFSRQRDPLQALTLETLTGVNDRWEAACGVADELLYIVRRTGAPPVDTYALEAWSGQDRQVEFSFQSGASAEMAADFAEGADYRVAIVDQGITGVQLDEFRYDPGPELTVPAPPPRVSLNGIEYSVGGPGTRFDFSLPTQELIVHGEPLVAGDRIRVSYGVRWIGAATDEGDGYIDSTQSLSTEDDVTEIVALADELLKEKGVVALRAAFTLGWNVDRTLRIGELVDVAEDRGRWVVSSVTKVYSGGDRVDILGEAQRDRFTSPTLDWLRNLRRKG